jgi:predicted restriction endonuclease
MFYRYFSSGRSEYNQFRKYLLKKYRVEYGGCHCSMCLNKLPAELLDTSHLKPRYSLTTNEFKNIENVQFFCKMCHSIYDRGYIGVNKSGIIESNNKIDQFNLSIIKEIGNIYSKYSNNNSYFLEWHYLNIFKKK